MDYNYIVITDYYNKDNVLCRTAVFFPDRAEYVDALTRWHNCKIVEHGVTPDRAVELLKDAKADGIVRRLINNSLLDFMDLTGKINVGAIIGTAISEKTRDFLARVGERSVCA